VDQSALEKPAEALSNARLEEHQTSPNSEVCNHLQSNPSHRVDFLNPKILAHSLDKYKLLISESLYIQRL